MVNHSEQKHFGIVYTPRPVVELMLDKIESWDGVSVCDPSCGDGQFLVATAERLCQKIHAGVDPHPYESTLQRLTGLDIDEQALNICRRRLNQVVEKAGCQPVNWNLIRVDALDRNKWTSLGPFDVVIGNPPYVRIQHLETRRRQRILEGNWSCMKGCADLYMLFFEMGLQLVRSHGSLIYITPSSWMNNSAGKPLRNLIRDHHGLVSITDFGGHQIFSHVTTYTAITHIKVKAPAINRAKGWACTGFTNGRPNLRRATIFKNQNGLRVMSHQDAVYLRRLTTRPKRLRDLADIHVGIQTLADDVFVLGEGNLDIEPGITRRIVKASVMKDGKDRARRRVIYPYNDGQLIPESDLAEQYPKAYAYLMQHKQQLLQRDKGSIDPAKWYGFGRDVSILSGFGEKILTSGMNAAPNFQKCSDPESLFYSGYCVKPRPGVPIDVLLGELNGADMARYIRLVSRPFRNGWFSYAKTYIQDFPLLELCHAR
ncbi:MAG: Eco57I restriction-modification methylase domain-containing protein [Rhodobacteraceae bacterium]|nr:Eco57I restriction-modification methylase domain-containing protein [Paracoccaceae bacterium]MCY4327271.1 Eco57I restriction-modification methylase domain-containing protein [Paracoccaceae bacterium]